MLYFRLSLRVYICTYKSSLENTIGLLSCRALLPTVLNKTSVYYIRGTFLPYPFFRHVRVYVHKNKGIMQSFWQRSGRVWFD